MAWYDTGTVSVTNGSTAVVGSGTNFISGAQIGEAFYGPDGRLYEIQAIISVTSLTIADPYLGSTQSGQAYKIVPTQSLVATLAAEVSELITDFQTVKDEAGAGKFQDGTAALPGIKFNLDQDTGFSRPAANQIGFSTAGVQRALLTSTGLNAVAIGATTPSTLAATTGSFSGDLTIANKVGIGATPSGWGSAFKVISFGDTGSINNNGGGTGTSRFGNNYYNDNSSFRYLYSNAATNYQQSSDGNHSWFNAPSGTAGNTITFTQAMTLDASGNLLVGTTTASGKLTLNGVAGSPAQTLFATGWGSGIGAFATLKAVNTSNADVIYFETSAAQVGRISITSTATSYVTSSDYRLKENVEPMQNALDTVAQLNPVTYTWKADGSAGQGFIAHELQAVVPDCVTGEKDAVDKYGKPHYQGVDTSFLVGILTKAIQEQQATITALTARIEALEGK